MAIFRSPANEKDEINNGLAAGASVPNAPPPPPKHRARLISLPLSSACHSGYSCHRTDGKF